MKESSRPDCRHGADEVSGTRRTQRSACPGATVLRAISRRRRRGQSAHVHHHATCIAAVALHAKHPARLRCAARGCLSAAVSRCSDHRPAAGTAQPDGLVARRERCYAETRQPDAFRCCSVAALLRRDKTERAGCVFCPRAPAQSFSAHHAAARRRDARGATRRHRSPSTLGRCRASSQWVIALLRQPIAFSPSWIGCGNVPALKPR